MAGSDSMLPLLRRAFQKLSLLITSKSFGSAELFQNRFRYYLCEREYYNPSNGINGNNGIIIHITSSTKGRTSSDVIKLGIKVILALKLPIVIDEKPIVNVPGRAIERLTTTSKCSLDTTCGSENIVIDGSFCFVDQSNDQIPFAPTHQCYTSRFVYVMRAPTCQPELADNILQSYFRRQTHFFVSAGGAFIVCFYPRFDDYKA